MRSNTTDIVRFQTTAEEELRKVMDRRHIRHSEFKTGGGKPPVRYASFILPDGEYEIWISDNITMTHDKQLFECYLTRELKNDNALIHAFAGRLDRWLGGGPWEEVDER